MRLAGRTRRVYLLIRGAVLNKSMSRYLVKRVTESENVELLANTEVRELAGEERLEGIVVGGRPLGRAQDTRCAEPLRLHRCGGQHRLARRGRRARQAWLRPGGGSVGPLRARSESLANLSRVPYPLETSLPGVFAAGDVRSGSIKRVASAVGEDSMAVRLVHQYLTDGGVHREREDSAPHR